MKRDSLWFRLFQDLPSCFFRMIGRSADDARRYTLDAIEYKETAVRLDGVFLPRKPEIDPAFIWEAQYYASEKVYANLLSKVGRFLEHGNPKQDWVAVVIYPNRAFEQKNLRPYRCLIESDQLVRIYLDELPPALPDQLEMGILEIIAAQPAVALEKARVLVPRLKASTRPPDVLHHVIQFIETIILYQFPKLTRKEIEAMLQVSDVRETRVFQEALEEGLEKGLEKGRTEGRTEGRQEGLQQGRDQGIEQVALRMLRLDRPVAEVAEATGLTAPRIRKLKKSLTAG